MNFRTLSSVLVDRLQFLQRAGLTFKGARDSYEVLGYERVLKPIDYRQRYERGGIAGRIVEALPKATWRGGAELIEDEDPDTITEFEQAWLDLDARLKLWSFLQKADILAALGQYAVVLIGAKGELESELPRGSSEDQLLYLSTFSEEDATIKDYDTDTKSPRFGLPVSYQLKRTNVASSDLTRPVHWTRVIHVAVETLDTEVLGQPRLKRCWNLLDDLDKVTGGGAEAFWMRANQGLQMDVDKDMKELSEPERTALQTQADEYQHNIRRILRTRGVSINTLGSDVADFSSPADAVITQIAGSIGIPKRILTGSEMGQLASGQDRDNWDTMVQDRRTSFAGPCLVQPLVDRLIEFGYLPKPTQYAVKWPEIKNLTEIERGAGAAQWANINQKQGETVFTADEIRDRWFSMAPLDGTEGSAQPRTAAGKKLLSRKLHLVTSGRFRV